MKQETNISSIICDVHIIDNTCNLHTTLLKSITKQLDSSSHGKESKNKDISTCEYPIYFNNMLKYIHVSLGMMIEDEKEISIIRPDILAETLGIPEFYCRYCSFAKFVVDKTDLSLKVWRIKTDCPPDYTFLNAFKPFD